MKELKISYRVSVWMLLLLVAALPLSAQKQLPEPTDYLVNDFAKIMSQAQVDALGKKLRDYVGETSTQIVVVTEESLEGEDPFEYAQRLATKWGIGGRRYSNGILLLVSEQDRKIRIQTGYGTEGFLPDVTAKRIIDGIMAPAFRQGNYYQGIDRATDAIMDLGRGEYEGDGFSNLGEGLPDWAIILIFIALIIFFSWISNGGGGGDDGGYYRGGRYDMPNRRGGRRGGTVIFPGGFGRGGGSSGGGGGGGGFGGFGGGGFGGFGGGGFGGGGAGGGW